MSFPPFFRPARKSPYYSLPCVRGEQVLSCEEPGGLFATCELGNFPLWGNFPTERGLYRARRCQARNEPDGGVVDPAHSFFVALHPISASSSGRCHAIRRKRRWHDGGSICWNFGTPLALRRGGETALLFPPRRRAERVHSLASLSEGGAPKGRRESPYFSLLLGANKRFLDLKIPHDRRLLRGSCRRRRLRESLPSLGTPLPPSLREVP